MTISDIARMAGVSSAAVSRYLNGGPLSEQKRAIIREVVEKTGYRPDTAAQTLRTGKVNQIGVIAPSIGSQSVGQITAGIASELDARNYLLLLGNTELDAQRELGYLTAMQRNHVAGIILLGSYYTPQLAQALKNCSVPVVVTGQRFPEVACVYNDDHTAARELTQRMLEHGRRRIVYIGGSERDDATGIQRREGVQDALRDAGLDGDQLPRICCNASVSYTHLTLPTKRIEENSVGTASFKKKRRKNKKKNRKIKECRMMNRQRNIIRCICDIIPTNKNK